MRASWLEKAPPKIRAEFIRLRREGRTTDQLWEWAQEQGISTSRAGIVRALRKVDRVETQARQNAATAAAFAERILGTVDDRAALCAAAVTLAAAVAEAARGLERGERLAIGELALLARAMRDLASARALLPEPPSGNDVARPKGLTPETLAEVKRVLYGV